MQKKVFLVPFVTMLIAAIFMLSGCTNETRTQDSQTKSENEKITILTTLLPQYDFAKAIGGDKVDVVLLLPPGVESHAYEPKPSDITAINNADIFVYTGEFMEPWSHDIIEGADKKVKVVDASVGIEMMEEEEEHEDDHEDEHEDEDDHEDDHDDDHEDQDEDEHDEAAHPWEWAGAFELEEGEYTWTFAQVDGDYADPKMKMTILSSESDGEESIESVEESAEKIFEADGTEKRDAESLIPDSGYELVFDGTKNVTSYKVVIESPGVYVFFAEHMPFEFETDEHFFKDLDKNDVEPIAEEPESGGHDHHHHGGVDPHIWLDFDNAKIMADNIAEALYEIDPQNADYYKFNLKMYQSKLTELDKAYKDTLSSCQTRTIVYGGHYAFGYMAERYDLDYVAAQGFSPDSEPTAKDMIALTEQIKEENINYVFYEELTSPKIAETLANETNSELLLLNGAHNLAKEDYDSGATFISIMEDNLKNLATGLGCQK